MLPRNGDDSSKPSDCIRNRLGSCSKLASQQTIPERRPVSGRPKFSRGERNFWMERPEAKNPPERPLLSAETGNVENRRQDPRRNGLFSIDDGFRGSGRLDGGVRSPMRTGLSQPVPVIPCYPHFSGTRIPAFAVGGCFSP